MHFLDFSKAFDRVAHCRLITKLTALRIDSCTLSWLRNFLSNRLQFTLVNNIASSLTYVTSGVPQSSVLGPLLILIYINDLPPNISSPMRIFPDDCIIYRSINSTNDHQAFQNDLSLIFYWCNTWLMALKAPKCQVISFSCKRVNSHFSYNANHIELLHTVSYKYWAFT